MSGSNPNEMEQTAMAAKGDETRKPGLSQRVSFGRNRHGEVAEVILNDPEHNYQKVIINHEGHFEDFPGIVQGKWIYYISREACDFDAGQVCYRTSFEKQDGGYRCLWKIQPGGRYWAEEDRSGIWADSEIVLYADLDERGIFKGPFCIYEIDENPVEEPDPAEGQGWEETEGLPMDILMKNAMEIVYSWACEEMPETGDFKPLRAIMHKPCSCYGAYVVLAPSPLDPEKRYIRVSAFRESRSDIVCSYYYEKKTNEEIRAYVQSEKAVADALHSFEELISK